MGASHIGARSDGVEYRLGMALPDGMAERLEAVAAGGLALFAARMQEGLLAASVAVGLESMRQLMEAEVTQVVGPKGRHQRSARTAYRHGHEAGTVVLGARKIPVQHPRVRTRSGQVLSVYRTLAEMDLLTEQTVARMLAGLSVREYRVGLEPVGTEVEDTASSISRSAVSRRFVAATKARLDAFRSRDLSGERFLVVFADGFDFVGQTMVGALGVTAAGIKVPLEVVQGSPEHAEVVRGLMSDLRDRGLNPQAGILFVLDGGKALSRAVKDVFGDRAVIQRCRVHKQRTVDDHLPESERGWVKAQMRRAWRNPDADQGIAELRSLATRLEKVNPDAAGSLREGLEETFTVTRLGLGGPLLKSLDSTNCVESMVDIVRRRCRNVKHWHPGGMRLRWAAAGMLSAERQFHRLNGYRQLPQLSASLAQLTGTDESELAATG